jgi:hypothetical protein
MNKKYLKKCVCKNIYVYDILGILTGIAIICFELYKIKLGEW